MHLFPGGDDGGAHRGSAVPFAPFDRAAHLRAPAGPVGALLDELAHARRASLDTLAALEAASGGALPLERRGLHPHLGEVTLQQLLATWTAHDLGHTVQIARTMARRYREDVGSWAEYMSVMSAEPAPPGPRDHDHDRATKTCTRPASPSASSDPLPVSTAPSPYPCP